MTQAKTARLDEAALREAALAYVARYGGTAAALARALERRIRRWAEAQGGEADADAAAVAARAAVLRAEAAKLIAGLTQAGAVDDAAFAESRVRRLRRAGRSRRAVLAHLAGKGVEAEVAGAAVPEDEAAELTAALAFARRRRVGPFAAGAEALSPEGRMRILGAFARAGFSGSIARRVLAFEREAAETHLAAERLGGA